MLFRRSNILDPVHAELDPRVWDAPDTVDPRLKPDHKQFIHHQIYSTLERHGYDGMDKWLSLVLTGSLTTYQYSQQSDCDISLWVDAEVFPEWSRAEMIGIMISDVDANHVTLPGTPHPLQCFVVASTKFRKEDLYKPGVRSGYDINTDKWIVPPDKSRVHDVKREEVEAYAIALENADKMEKLIRYEPDKAVMFYDQLHRRRQRDMQEGKGDFSPSNIAYKMLDQRGLLQHIAEISGRHIGSITKMAGTHLLHVAPRAARQSILREGLRPSADGYTYLFNNTWDGQEEAENFGGEGSDLWHVNHAGLEPHLEDWNDYLEGDYTPDEPVAFRTQHQIGPERLSLARKGDELAD